MLIHAEIIKGLIGLLVNKITQFSQVIFSYHAYILNLILNLI